MQSTSIVLLLSALLFVCALAVSWIIQNPLWSFARIEIKGDLEHNGSSSIRTHAIPLLKGNFFTLNLYQAREAFKTIPWVREVQIRRIWPHTLEVQLHEHQAVAHWKNVNSAVSKESPKESPTYALGGLINNQGELFFANTVDVEDENLPLFIGTEDRIHEMWQLYRDLLPILAPLTQNKVGANASEITQLRVSTRG